MILAHAFFNESKASESNDIFLDGINLIHSADNSRGKTTFLRCLLYALGYDVPNLKGIDFTKVRCKISVKNNDKLYIITRDEKNISVSVNNTKSTFILPNDHLAFLSYLLGSERFGILKNLLGFIYFDQDKGWTHFNGTNIIGRYRFKSEEVLSELGQIDISSIKEQINTLKRERDEFKFLKDSQKLNDDAYSNIGLVNLSDDEKKITDLLVIVDAEIEDKKLEIKNIEETIEDENRFFRFIESMSLYVKGENNERILVCKDNIEGANYNSEFTKAHLSLLKLDLKKLLYKKTRLKEKQSQIKEKKDTDIFGRNIGNEVSAAARYRAISTELSQEEIEAHIANLNGKINKLSKTMVDKVKYNNPYIGRVYKYFKEYGEELSVSRFIDSDPDFIFKKDGYKFSGTNLKKMIFALKLAFLKVIENELKITLPIIIDSPKSKELTEENFQLMMSVLKKHFSENQIIIASIDNDIEHQNIVEIIDRAIESREGNNDSWSI